MSGLFSELFPDHIRAAADPSDQGKRWVTTVLAHLDWIAANPPKKQTVESGQRRLRGRPRKVVIEIGEEVRTERKTRSMKANIGAEESIEALLNKPAIIASPRKGQHPNQVGSFCR